MTEILIAAAIIVAACLVLWFFVIHKHVTQIHAKIDTILHRTPPPVNIKSTATPGGKLP